MASVLAIAASLVVAVAPAEAHGYVSEPPSRQASCAAKKVANCGEAQWEPQSVEAPKGSMACSGGGKFKEMDDDSLAWPVTNVGTSVQFTWRFTARHSTTTYEYFIGTKRIAVFDAKGKTPGETVTHTVDLSGYPGKQKVFSRWNIADTPMAFYSCMDLNVGRGSPSDGDSTPAPQQHGFWDKLLGVLF